MMGQLSVAVEIPEPDIDIFLTFCHVCEDYLDSEVTTSCLDCLKSICDCCADKQAGHCQECFNKKKEENK